MGGLPVCSSVPCDPSLQGKTAIFDSSNCIWNFGDAATGGGTTISFGAPNFTFGNANVEGASNRAVRTDATLDFFVAPTITFGTAHAEGISAKGIRSDATIKYPTSLMSTANLSLFTLTDTGVDQVLTGTLGDIRFSAAGLDIAPNVSGTMDNGRTDLRWRDGWFMRRLTVSDPNTVPVSSSNSLIEVSARASATDPNLQGWRCYGGEALASSGGAGNDFGLCRPLVNDHYNLGGLNERIQHINMSGDLQIGTSGQVGCASESSICNALYFSGSTGSIYGNRNQSTIQMKNYRLTASGAAPGVATHWFPKTTGTYDLGCTSAGGTDDVCTAGIGLKQWRNATFSGTVTATTIVGTVTTDRLTASVGLPSTLILSDNDTNQTLQQSLAGAKLLFKDSAAATMLEIWPAATGTPGLATLGHAHFGSGSSFYSAGPNLLTGFIFDEVLSANPSTTNPFALDESLDADLNGAFWITGNYQTRLLNGFDPFAAGGAATLTGLRSALSGSHTNVAVGSVSSYKSFDSSVNASIAATSPAWAEIVGFHSGTLSISGVVPTKSYGIKITSAGNGTSAFAASFVGMTQASTTSEIGLGRAQGVTPTNTISSKTSAGSILQMKLNSAQRYEWDTTAFYPVTNGAADVGKDNNGWGGLWFKDASAAFEDKVTYNSSATLTADRNRVMDFPDVNTTLKIRTGTASLNFGVALLNACEDLTLTVTGASDGDSCSVGAPAGSVVAGAQFTCWRSAADTVTIRHCCVGTAVTCADPASGTFRATTMSL